MFKLKEEAAYCLLCSAAPCSWACPDGLDPERMIRAVRFNNERNAARYVEKEKCAGCEGACEKACVHYDRPIHIRKIAAAVPEAPDKNAELPSLKINYCGVECENPFFLASSIISANYEMCANAFKAGWGGAVFKTVSIEPCHEVSPRFDATKENAPTFFGLKNLEQLSEHDINYNLSIMRRLKRNFPTKVLIASIMGSTDEEWAALSRLVTEAGADIIECNYSCPQMAAEGLGSDIGQNPELVKHYTAIVKQATDRPVIVKMTPNIQDITLPAIAGVEGGADSIAAINTIKCITGINPDTFDSYPDVNGKCSVSGYSGKAVKPIALKFIYDLASCKKLSNIPISGIGGIETWRDALDFLLLGCRNVQVATAVMQYGYRIIDDLIQGMQLYMKDKGISSLDEIIGKGLPNIVPAEELDRETMVYPRFNHELCLHCGRCVTSCLDAGHQALLLNGNNLIFTPQKCVGCHLCAIVCPVNAITTDGKRIPKPAKPSLTK